MIYLQHYEKIINNYLDDLYLYVFMQIKDEKESINIIFKAFESIFLFSNNIERISERIKKECDKFIKENKKEINYIENEIIIPKIIYKLNFNIHKLFNEKENLIFSNYLIYNRQIESIKDLYNLPYQDILTSIKKVFTFIKKMFLNQFDWRNWIEQK